MDAVHMIYAKSKSKQAGFIGQTAPVTSNGVAIRSLPLSMALEKLSRDIPRIL
jgi:hypothetical protein